MNEPTKTDGDLMCEGARRALTELHGNAFDATCGEFVALLRAMAVADATALLRTALVSWLEGTIGGATDDSKGVDDGERRGSTGAARVRGVRPEVGDPSVVGAPGVSNPGSVDRGGERGAGGGDQGTAPTAGGGGRVDPRVGHSFGFSVARPASLQGAMTAEVQDSREEASHARVVGQRRRPSGDIDGSATPTASTSDGEPRAAPGDSAASSPSPEEAHPKVTYENMNPVWLSDSVHEVRLGRLSVQVLEFFRLSPEGWYDPIRISHGIQGGFPLVSVRGALTKLANDGQIDRYRKSAKVTLYARKGASP